MKDNTTPEEKLLKLIKGQKKAQVPVALGNVPLMSKALPETSVIMPLEPLAAAHFGFLAVLKSSLIVCFAAASCYFIFSLLYPLFFLRSDSPHRTLPKETLAGIGETHALKPYEYYAQVIKNRQIFSAGNKEEGLKEGVSKVNIMSSDLMKDLSFVGVISGENPQAVIEDKKAQRTYYVSRGQAFGDFTVEEIKEGKIVLNYKGQKYDLYL